MTIRETIDGLMADPSEQESFQNDPDSFLDEHGLGDLPSDLVDVAFVHYADTTSIANADVLAPLVTRAGPVPYEETDLPDGVTDELGEGAATDPWAMVTFGATPATATEVGEQDPADLDDTSVPAADVVDAVGAPGPEFGAGETSISDGFAQDDTGDDPFFEDTPASEPGLTPESAAEEVAEIVADEPTTEYNADVDGFTDAVGSSIEEDIDPADLDFD